MRGRSSTCEKRNISYSHPQQTTLFHIVCGQATQTISSRKVNPVPTSGSTHRHIFSAPMATTRPPPLHHHTLFVGTVTDSC